MPIKREKSAQDLKPSRRNKAAVNNLLIVLHSSTLGSKSKCTGFMLEVIDEIKHLILNTNTNNGK